MNTLTMQDAEKIQLDFMRKDYSTWDEFGNHKAKVKYIGKDNWLEHRKDSKICLLRGDDVHYWRGMEVLHLDIEFGNGRYFLKCTVITYEGDISYKFFPIEVKA